MRKMAKELGKKRETIRLLVKDDLGFKPYKFQNAQYLNDQMKKKRHDQSGLLLEWHANPNSENWLYTDE